jgi:outer membrane protein TolC
MKRLIQAAFTARWVVCAGVMMAPALLPNTAYASSLTLESAIEQAKTFDPWLEANRAKEQAGWEMAQGADALPNAKLTVGLLSLPIDTFDVHQEGMTQLNVGLSQRFPRGETLALSKQKWEQSAQLQPALRAERNAKTQLEVESVWLSAMKAQKSIALIEQNRRYFEQLNDIAISNYSYALGGTQQQDLIQAKVELIELDDRLTELKRMHALALSKLSGLITPVGEAPRAYDSVAGEPSIPLNEAFDQFQSLDNTFTEHPLLVAKTQAIEVAKTDTKIAKEAFKPEWSVNTGYGLRGTDAMGRDRADLLSVGVSVDLPLFSTQKQTAELKASHSDVQSLLAERQLLLRDLTAQFHNLVAEVEVIAERRTLYTQQLLPGIRKTADAATNAYRVDNGRFAEVVQIRIRELNAKLTLLSLEFEQARLHAALNYLMTTYNANEEGTL